MAYNPPQIKKVIVKKYDGSSVSKDDQVAVTLNFPMWFGDDLINEINERDITAVVIKDYDGGNHIHLATDDADLIIAAQIAFWKFRV